MTYFSYHAVAKKLIDGGRLIGYCYTDSYHHISPALLLFFDSEQHPIMPIRKNRWPEYLPLLPADREISSYIGD